jgi:hypothetical protein
MLMPRLVGLSVVTLREPLPHPLRNQPLLLLGVPDIELFDSGLDRRFRVDLPRYPRRDRKPRQSGRRAGERKRWELELPGYRRREDQRGDEAST